MAVVPQQILVVYSAQFCLGSVNKSVRFIVLAQVEETRLITGVTHNRLKKYIKSDDTI